MFALTDATRFENIKGRVVIGDWPKRAANPSEHQFYDLKVGSLCELAIFLRFPAARLTA